MSCCDAGDEDKGELGNGGSTGFETATPAAVAGEHAFAQLAVGDKHTCGLRLDGKVMCWGTNQLGEHGNGGGAAWTTTPVEAAQGRQFSQLASSNHYVCAIASDPSAGKGARGELHQARIQAAVAMECNEGPAY